MSKLRKQEYAKIYFLHGEEGFYIDEISNYIMDNVLDESEKPFNQVVVYGKEVDFMNVIDFARQFPLMAERRVVIVREAQEMKTIKGLQSYFNTPANHTILVINYKYRTYGGDQAFRDAMAEHGVLFMSKRLYDNKVAAWVQTRVKKYDISIQAEAAFLVSELLGANLSKIDNELEKLATILGKGKDAGLDEINRYIGFSKDYNVFALNKALGEKNIVKANRIINYFGNNPKQTSITVVIGALNGYFCRVLIVQANTNRNDKELAKLAGIGSSYFVKEYRRAAKLYPRIKIEQIFSILAEYDLRSKGVDNRKFSNKELLKEMIFKILH